MSLFVSCECDKAPLSSPTFLFTLGSPPDHLLLHHYPHNSLTHLQSKLIFTLSSTHYTSIQQFEIPQMSASSMATPFFLLLISSFFAPSLSSRPSSLHRRTSHIAVMGLVYCDVCHNNNYSTNSYFISGAKVKIDCKFNALSPETAEQISFSVNRTTNKSGVYRLEIPSIEGIECAEDSELASSCEATLIKSSSSLCNVPGYRTTTDVMTVKSKHANLCFYSFSALNFRPKKRDAKVCGA